MNWCLGGHRLPLSGAAVLDYQVSQLPHGVAPVHLAVWQEADAESLFQLHLDLYPVELITTEARDQHCLPCNSLHRQAFLLGDHHPDLVEHTQVQTLALDLGQSQLLLHNNPMSLCLMSTRAFAASRKAVSAS